MGNLLLAHRQTLFHSGASAVQQLRICYTYNNH